MSCVHPAIKTMMAREVELKGEDLVPELSPLVVI